MKRYRLLGPDGVEYPSEQPGTLGGNRKLKIYGRLDCRSANRAVPRGYPRHRVFFADEEAAISAGYRPCGHCMRERYRAWKAELDNSTRGPASLLSGRRPSGGDPRSVTPRPPHRDGDT